MLVYRGVFYGHVSFIPLQGIWDVALRKGPTTSVYPASGGPRRRGLVQCLHFGIVLPQILGELIQCDECFFLTGWKLKPVTIANKFKPPNQLNELMSGWWSLNKQYSTILSCRKNSQHLPQPLAVEKMRPIAEKQFSFLFFRVGIFDDVVFVYKW